MNRYKQTSITGESYVRADQVAIKNPLGGNPTVTFTEEQVINIEDSVSTRAISNVQETLIYQGENANITEKVQVINPVTLEEVEGATMTYGELVGAIYSMYYHLAKKRNAQVEETEEEEPIED